ncbi:Uma2 family endonuclease [Verrucomicrobiales bacterium]|nr:Uma2 family endonuclease [Verrucomicrobiales bacterium]
MTWDEACSDPFLAELPYKIELNEFGHPILLSPHNRNHSALQGIIQDLLRKHKEGGMVAQEAAVETAKGTRSADVAWMTIERWRDQADGASFSTAPQICIEVLSPTNSKAEMEEKRNLYFGAGADEVWICDLLGRMSFYRADSPDEIASNSQSIPEFPNHVELP